MINQIVELYKKLSEGNYIRKADPNQDYWFDFSQTKLNGYIAKFKDNFNLIIYGSEDIADDFYILPYRDFKHIFNEQNLAHDERSRWIGRIKYNELRVTNTFLRPDIAAYYGDLAISLLENQIQ